MAELVIGHTTHDSALLWVRGDKRHSLARVTLKPQTHGDPISSDRLQLTAEGDYIGVADFAGRLEPGKHYRVVAEFASNAAALARRPIATGGQFRTSPEPKAAATGFSFLFASCNLSTSRLESLGALLASALGTLAMSESVKRDSATWMWPRQTQDPERRMSSRRFWLPLVWRVLELCPWILRFAARRGAWLVWAGVLQVTRFQQPTPRLHSPFVALLEALDSGAENSPVFMIHAGDQIYFDIDAPSRPAEVEEYRRAYRQAWFEDWTTRAVLASCPHYMILDDHEIFDSFANQPPLLEHLKAGKRAYDEYVQCRQPRECDNALYYRFDYGQASFFVLDTRTQRVPGRKEMISEKQLKCLQDWLQKDHDQLKFIVSSVPFVAELRPGASPNPTAGGDERSDKWCGAVFRAQRDAIIDFVYEKKIPHVVFLVGDMHCTYHATMRVGPPKDRIAIHEIAAGPISQVQFAARRDFYDQFRDVSAGRNPYSILLRSFHGSTAAAVRVTINPDSSPLLTWAVVPTSRANGYQPPPLTGCISFAEGAR